MSVYSGGAPVSIKRLFGLTVDVLSAGGGVDVGSIYADRAAVSTAAGPSTVLRAATAGAGGQRTTAASQGAGGAPSSSSGRLHVGHIACLKGEARLESGGGSLEVDGLEGNAALLSRGGNVKVRAASREQQVPVDLWETQQLVHKLESEVHTCAVDCLNLPFYWLLLCCWPCALPHTAQVHLHEHAGLVYVDSDGGSVTAWLSPSGSPLGLQVKAAGGVCLDPALKVSLMTGRQHMGGGGVVAGCGCGGRLLLTDGRRQCVLRATAWRGVRHLFA